MHLLSEVINALLPTVACFIDSRFSAIPHAILGHIVGPASATPPVFKHGYLLIHPCILMESWLCPKNGEILLIIMKNIWFE